MTTLGIRIGGFATGLASAFYRGRERPERTSTKSGRVARANGRAGKASRRASGKAQDKKPAPFQAVEVRRGLNACRAAIDLEGKRFLAREAPTLPLPDCDRSKCGCRFQKLPDRRTAGDRRFVDDHSTGFAGALHKDRRNRRDRRRQT